MLWFILGAVVGGLLVAFGLFLLFIYLFHDFMG